jgi:hypothetical protein
MRFGAGIRKQEDQGRQGHPAHRGNPRQGAAAPGRERAVKHFLLDFEPNKQEKDRHHPVVDPVLDRQAQQMGVEDVYIGAVEGRVGDDHRQRGGGQEHHGSGGLASEEPVQHRLSPGNGEGLRASSRSRQ